MDGITTSPLTTLHVDINSYFATLLQQENPRLRGKSVGVVKNVGRTCLIAVSKEAKTKGIKTGCRLKDARLLDPQILPVPVDFDRAWAATKKLQKLFNDVAPQVHIYSLDEAFIDISDCQRFLYPDVYTLGQQLQQRIKEHLGEWVTCSVGISYNRLLAKIASETALPDTVAVIDERNRDGILAEVRFADVCGVGARLEAKLARLGVTTPYLLRFCSEAELSAVVGPFWAKQLQKVAYGEETITLRQLDRILPHMKSVGRSITGYSLSDDESEIKAILYNLCEEIIYKVRRMELAGRQVWVGLYGHDQRWSSHITLKHHICHTTEFFEYVYKHLYQSWSRSFPIIKFAVRLSLLKSLWQVPQPLFGRWHQREKVSRALDAITHKYGLFTMRPGTLINRPMIKPEVTGFLGDKQYQLEVR